MSSGTTQPPTKDAHRRGAIDDGPIDGRMRSMSALATTPLLSRIRRLILVVLVVGMTGILIELLLLSHYEGATQLIPVALIVLALMVVAWHTARPNAGTVRALQAAMTLFLAAGIAGIALHFNGAAAFQLEIDPSQGSWDLFTKVVRAHAPPLLAPGAMLQLGLVGLIYTHRHPAP